MRPDATPMYALILGPSPNPFVTSQRLRHQF